MAIQDGVWYVQNDNTDLWTVFTIVSDSIVPPSPNGNADDFVKTNGEELENTHPQHAEIIAVIPPGGHSTNSAIHMAAVDV